VAEVSDAVVTIRCHIVRDDAEGGSSGSGFVLRDSPLVVTNRHVVDGAKEIEVITRDEHSSATRIVRLGKDVDLAVLEPRQRLKRGALLGDSDQVGPGEFVFVIGNPLGGLPNSVTTGVISGIRKLEDGRTYLQLDAAISPGNSGGPVFNIRGEVIGVATASLAATRAQNLNLAVPSNEVKRLLGGARRTGSIQNHATKEAVGINASSGPPGRCPRCNGSGFEPAGPCTACGGTGRDMRWSSLIPTSERWVKCEECGGTAWAKCYACNGSEKRGGYGGEEYAPECSECEGIGKVKCQACDGRGAILVED